MIRAAALLALLALLAVLALPAAQARDLGQWPDNDQSRWYRALMQPDNHEVSCCGPADVYWADEIHVRDGKVYAVITDDRDDKALDRMHVDNGTEVEIPPNKVKWSETDPQRSQKIERNPTGHGVVFLAGQSLYVWCYVAPGGV